MEPKLLTVIKSTLLSQGNWNQDFLKEHQELFNGLSIFIYNLENKQFEYLSDEILSIIGYTSEDLQMTSFKDLSSLVHEDDYTEWLLNIVTASVDFQESSHDKNYCIVREYRIRHKKNYWVYLQIISTPLQMQENRILSFFGIVKDVSKEKMKEAYLMSEIAKRENSVTILRKIIHDYKNLESIPQLKQSHGRISPREIEVLQLISQGYSNREIAETLFISPNTAVTHRKNLLIKFNVKNSAQLVKEASRMFWLI
jgi:PAS domain S-box-containing protein